MKNILLTTGLLVFLFSTTQLSAQREILDTPPVFITLGAGINHTGLLSLGVEVPVHENIAVFGDAGVGGWGYKFGIGAGYFPKSVRKGPGINLAYYTAGGTGGDALVQFDDGSNAYEIALNRVGTLNFTYSQNWHLGKRGKFSLVAGYAVAAGNKDNSYDILGQQEVESAVKTFMGVLHPDGLIIGFKFLFGVGGGR